MRLVKDRGWLCTKCIADDDYVFCPSCKRYRRWTDFKEHVYVHGGRSRYHACKSCHNPKSSGDGYGYCEECGKRTRPRLTGDGRLVCITCLPVTGRVLCQGCGEFKDVTEFRRVHNQLLGVSRMRICPECESNHIPVRINPITYRRKMMENKDESREGLEYHEDVPGLDGLYNIDLLIQDGVISREGDEYRLSVRWALSIVSETFISDPVVREIREKILSGDFCFHNKLKD